MAKANLWVVPDWPAPNNVHAATTLRVGGVSLPPYESLNLAQHVGDDPQAVANNRQLIKAVLGLPAEPVWLDQQHSNQVIQVDQASLGLIADASYTSSQQVVCAVLTADCLPILICDQEGTTVASIHAGWRGLLAGIIENTMARLPNRVWLAWLGPAIGPACFEVGDEVRAAFLQKSAIFAAGFTPKCDGKWLADIYHLARIQLTALKVEQIFGGEFCTFTEQELFFSYRRDKQTGRMATLIWRD
ncbi:MAG: peptidoglycan editing factor PgeF [Methylococcaceae bacterium]|jgi:hypothetical protein